MQADLTNLDRLNDLALPPEVAWLPPAAGWYVVLTCLLLTAGWLAGRAIKKWKAAAYRRQALYLVSTADNVAALAEILRRTALAAAPRSTIADLSGAAWPDWLSQHYAAPLPAAVRQQLTTGVYSPQTTSSQPDAINALREYAVQWIKHHQVQQHAHRQGG